MSDIHARVGTEVKMTMVTARTPSPKIVRDATDDESDVSGQATSTSVGKAFALLNAFLGTNNVALGVSDIARRSGVAKSTAHRLLRLLELHGFVERSGDCWRPGAHLFRLGNTVSVCRPHRLRDQALPYLQELCTETRTLVSLAVLHGSQVLYVDKLVARGSFDSPVSIGGCLPVYCTAAGKAMLAFSPPEVFDEVVAAGMPSRTSRTLTTVDELRAEIAQIRQVGYALDQQELKVGLVCVSAPIFHGHTVAGAISLSLDARRGLPQRYAARLMRATDSLSRLGAPADDEDLDLISVNRYAV
jgi:DNA-binding IclR family transcriptional regulator